MEFFVGRNAFMACVACFKNARAVGKTVSCRRMRRNVCPAFSLNALVNVLGVHTKILRWFFALFDGCAADKKQKGRGQVCVYLSFFLLFYVCVRGRIDGDRRRRNG